MVGQFPSCFGVGAATARQQRLKASVSSRRTHAISSAAAHVHVPPALTTSNPSAALRSRSPSPPQLLTNRGSSVARRNSGARRASPRLDGVACELHHVSISHMPCTMPSCLPCLSACAGRPPCGPAAWQHIAAATTPAMQQHQRPAETKRERAVYNTAPTFARCSFSQT